MNRHLGMLMTLIIAINLDQVSPAYPPMTTDIVIVIPFAPTRRKTVTYFRRFFTVPEYSPIGVKFPPITALVTLYTVKKKNLENFQYFFSYESLNVPN